jgi:hypothetical protein
VVAATTLSLYGLLVMTHPDSCGEFDIAHQQPPSSVSVVEKNASNSLNSRPVKAKKKESLELDLRTGICHRLAGSVEDENPNSCALYFDAIS